MIKKNIVITGNHHTPAIELIQQLKNDHITWHIFYITHSTQNETHVQNSLKKLNLKKIYDINCGKFYRYSLLKTLKGIPDILKATSRSYKIIKSIKPDIVISFGGYVSVPVIFTAWLQKVICFTHEQTSTLSLSSFINGFFVKKICLSFGLKHMPFFFRAKYLVTGNLLRRQIFSKTTKNYQFLQNHKLPIIYASGGNQSSQIINDTLLKLKKDLATKCIIIHHIGNLGFDLQNSKNYYPTHYVGLDDIGWVLNNSDLVINRAGANYCQEIVALNKNSILIPLPTSARGEQLKNASWVKSVHPKNTIIIDQSQLTPQLLLSSIKKLLETKPGHPAVNSRINTKILSLIHQYV